MKRFASISLFSLVILGFLSVAIAADAPKDEKKRTSVGKYATAAEAYEMWSANPKTVKIVDVRTQEEYVFVGHPPMACNIPSKLWTGKWDAEKKSYVLEDNPQFEALVKTKSGSGITVIVMCRSGHRSAAAVERLAKAGLTNVYNMIDGFEGDVVKDNDSYYKGKRIFNGWRNSGAPWTYALDPALIYLPQK
jgi:rhodanese-related sulfurtransferase